MSELQTDTNDAAIDLITQDVATDASGTVENGPDLATGEGDNPDAIKQEAVNKAINKQHAKYQEERRKNEAVNRDLAAANERLAQFEANKPALHVPDMPDPYEDGYEEKMRARDTAMQAKNRQDYDNNARQSQQQYTQQQQHQAAESKRAEAGQNFMKTANQIGISEDNLNKSVQLVVNNGIDQNVAEFIINDPDGPLIIQHLASNPMDQDELRGMSPMQAAGFINGQLKTKASALRPKQSNAPAPIASLNGGGVNKDAGKYPHSKGATFS